MRLLSSLGILAITSSSVDIVLAFSFMDHVDVVSNTATVHWVSDRPDDPDEFDLWITKCKPSDVFSGVVSSRVDIFLRSTQFSLPRVDVSVRCKIKAVTRGHPSHATTLDRTKIKLNASFSSPSVIMASALPFSTSRPSSTSNSTFPATSTSSTSETTRPMTTFNTTHTGLSRTGSSQTSSSQSPSLLPSQPTSSLLITDISTSTSKKAPVGAILAGTISGSVVLGALIFFIIIMLRRRRRLSSSSVAPYVLIYDGNRVGSLDKKGPILDISRERSAFQEDQQQARDAPAQSAHGYSGNVDVHANQEIEVLQLRIAELKGKHRLLDDDRSVFKQPPVYTA